MLARNQTREIPITLNGIPMGWAYVYDEEVMLEWHDGVVSMVPLARLHDDAWYGYSHGGILFQAAVDMLRKKI